MSEQQATVAFASANAMQGLMAERAVGSFDNEELQVPLAGDARLVMRLRADGDMEMSYWKPHKQIVSAGVLTQGPLASLYTRSIERVPMPWQDNGAVQTLEMVVYRPAGAGPFPTMVFNHGSTGMGTRPEWFKLTWTSPEVAQYFASKGWQVLFAQRRGRGQSDGLYDEGFASNRASGYSCEPARAIAGFDHAIADLDVVMAHVLARPDVDRRMVLMGGVSRGGILAVAYAGLRPEMFTGVVNFVGGWIGDACASADAVNPELMQRGAKFPRPMLWLYGDQDPYYKLSHSRASFEAFRAAGGQADFLEFAPALGRDGHMLHVDPPLWQADVDRYLDALTSPPLRAQQ